MKVKNMVAVCRGFGSRMLFAARKHSPELCLIGAGISFVATIVTACKAAKETEQILKEHNDTLEEVKEIIEKSPEKYGPKQERRMITGVYVMTGVKFAKTWAPTAIGIASTAVCVGGMYKILSARNAVLASAVTALEDENRKLKAALPEGKDISEEKKENPEDTGIMKYTPPKSNALFDHFWGEGDKKWSTPSVYGPRINPIVLRQIEDNFNVLLPVKGAIFMNEIYDIFGWQTTMEGQFAGWVWDPKKGEHQIDFGLRNPKYPETIAFMNGDTTDGCWLRFNCDTYILNRTLSRMNDVKEFYRKGEKCA